MRPTPVQAGARKQQGLGRLRLLPDIAPLRHNLAFRRLLASQFISGMGTMVSDVALPWQL